jgi:hypothetical protein
VWPYAATTSSSVSGRPSDRGRRPEAAQEGAEVEAAELRQDVGGVDAGDVAAHGVEERHPARTADGVQHGAVEERRPVARHQRVQAAAAALGLLQVIAVGEQAEWRAGAPALGVEGARQTQRQAQLLDVLGVRERRVLVEPLRRQHLGRRAPAAAAVLELHARAHVCLGRRRERDRAEAERHAQAHIALEQLHLAHVETQGVGHRAGFAQTPRSCMSLIWRLMTLSRYSACFIGARFR